MLVLPTTALARGMRHKQPLLSCRTNSLEVATACVQAAIVRNVPLLVTLDATVPTTMSHEVLLASSLILAREAQIEIGVEVIIPCHKTALQWWLNRGVTAVTLSGTSDDIQRLAHEAVSTAHAFHCDVGVELIGNYGPEHLRALVEATKVAYVRLPNTSKLVTIREKAGELRVPVIAGELHMTPKKAHEFVASGAAGLTMHSELEEAFTAGVRTGIRDRSVSDPVRYLGYGATAVRELVSTYCNYFYQ